MHKYLETAQGAYSEECLILHPVLKDQLNTIFRAGLAQQNPRGNFQGYKASFNIN